MSRTRPPQAPIAIVLVLTLLVSGCIGSDDLVSTGELRTDSEFVELGPATAVKVSLEVGLGSVVVQGGAAKLMEATFRYNVDRWRPRFTYTDQGEFWNLTVRQPQQGLEVDGSPRNEWDVRLGDMVPVDVTAQVGSGSLDFRAAGMDLVSVSLGTGAGDVNVDLTGQWSAPIIARAGTGAGNVDIIVPSQYGVQVSLRQGAGQVVAPGFERVGDNYKNAAFDTADVLILVAVEIGTGDLTVLELP